MASINTQDTIELLTKKFGEDLAIPLLNIPFKAKNDTLYVNIGNTWYSESHDKFKQLIDQTKSAFGGTGTKKRAADTAVTLTKKQRRGTVLPDMPANRNCPVNIPALEKLRPDVIQNCAEQIDTINVNLPKFTTESKNTLGAPATTVSLFGG